MNSTIKLITFSGVDGAGKTTILRKFVEVLKEDYQLEVVELRHRPSVIPILSSLKHGKEKAELKTMEALPRTGSNDSKISSYIRFFYYLFDYLIGQWVIYFKYTVRNKVVVYDRYYFDFIVDSRRTNIDLNSRFTRYFYRFVFKPDMNIFLYADTEVILGRKQEMDAKSIDKLTKDYKRLFENLACDNPDQYVALENIDIERTLEQIDSIYCRLTA